jgi:hypothetical protein
MSFSELSDLEPIESRQLEGLEVKLIARFSPPLRPEEVQRCLLDCVAAYESASIRSYLPLLIERDATTRLQQFSVDRSV